MSAALAVAIFAGGFPPACLLLGVLIRAAQGKRVRP